MRLRWLLRQLTRASTLFLSTGIVVRHFQDPDVLQSLVNLIRNELSKPMAKGRYRRIRRLRLQTQLRQVELFVDLLPEGRRRDSLKDQIDLLQNL